MTAVSDNLESGAIFALICSLAMGLYKLIEKMGVQSKCGIFSLDCRKPETKMQEIKMEHETNIRKLELESLRLQAGMEPVAASAL